MTTGKSVFVTNQGVNYLLDRYLSAGDREDLRRMNTAYSQERFEKELIKRLERGSGSRNWIPSNYTDELASNASAIIGTTRTSRRTKNGKNVDVYETVGGRQVYEDKRGRIRDYHTGRYLRKDVFD